MISIIIVTWNNEDLICNCINSILKYEKNVEIIIVDNNSADNTVLKAREMNKEEVKVIPLKGNLGFSKANNIGVDAATGENILFLNPDTLFIETGLNEVFSRLDENIGIVSCRFLNADGSLQPSCYNFDTPFNILLEQFMLGNLFPNYLREMLTPYLGKHNKTRTVDWTVGAFLAMKKTDFLTINGFTEDYFLYSEDMDICYKIKKVAGKKTLFDSNFKIIHLGGQSEKKDISSTKHQKLLDSKFVFSKIHGLNKNIPTLLFSYRMKHFIFLSLSMFLSKKDFNSKLTKYKSAKEYLHNKL